MASVVSDPSYTPHPLRINAILLPVISTVYFSSAKYDVAAPFEHKVYTLELHLYLLWLELRRGFKIDNSKRYLS